MKVLVPVIAAAAALVSTTAFAQDAATDGLYGSIGASYISADEARLTAVTGRLGAQMSETIGFEAEASAGVGGDEVSGIDVHLQHDLGIFMTGQVSLGELTQLMARVGYGSSSLEFDNGTTTVEEEGAGLRIGAAVQFFPNGKDGFRFEYTRFDNNDDLDADVLTVSYVRRFR